MIALYYRGKHGDIGLPQPCKVEGHCGAPSFISAICTGGADLGRACLRHSNSCSSRTHVEGGEWELQVMW